MAIDPKLAAIGKAEIDRRYAIKRELIRIVERLDFVDDAILLSALYYAIPDHQRAPVKRRQSRKSRQEAVPDEQALATTHHRT